MATFEGYERRIEKINSVLSQYGIDGIDGAKAVCDEAGAVSYTHLTLPTT